MGLVEYRQGNKIRLRALTLQSRSSAMHSNHFLEEITIARAHFSEKQVPEPICILCNSIVHDRLHALSLVFRRYPPIGQ